MLFLQPHGETPHKNAINDGGLYLPPGAVHLSPGQSGVDVSPQRLSGVWGQEEAWKVGEPQRMSPDALDGFGAETPSPCLGMLAGARLHPSCLLQEWSSAGDSVKAGVARRPEPAGRRGRTSLRTAERTLESNLALARHILGLPIPVLPSCTPGWEGAFLSSKGLFCLTQAMADNSRGPLHHSIHTCARVT